MAKPLIIALDLDFTLARFRGGYPGLYALVESFWLSETVAAAKLREAIDSNEGLSFERYATMLFPHAPATASSLSTSLEKHFETHFDWYEEVPDWLSKHRMAGIPLVLVTAGAAHFQEKKVRHLGFVFDEVHITDIARGKGGILLGLMSRHPDASVVYVDDKISELVRIRETAGIDHERLRLFHMVRGDAPERGEVSN